MSIKINNNNNNNNNNNSYYLKPIKGIYNSPPNNLVTGDRYILNNDIGIIIEKGGKNQDFPDGAIIQVLNSSKSYLRQGTELIEKDPLIKLIGIINFYISPTGSNLTGTGSILQPWSSLGYALSLISRKYILQGATIVINFADGIYDTSNQIRIPDFALAGNIYNQLIFQGNSLNPEAVEFKTKTGTAKTFFEFNASGMRTYFKNITFNGVNPDQDLLRVFNNPGLFIDQTVILKGQFRYGLVSLSSAILKDVPISNLILKNINCKSILHTNGGSINLQATKFIIPSGSLTQFEYFVESSTNSTIQLPDNSENYLVEGTAIGKKFKIHSTGEILFGSDYSKFIPLDFLPGDAPGEIASGGFYQTFPDIYSVDPAIFGAKGDGIKDDTAAIQAALDRAGQILEINQALGLSGKSEIKLKGGSYLISSPLIIRNGTTLIGETKANPYPNRISGFKSNNNLLTGTEIICSENFIGTSAIILEPDNTNIENCIIDGHNIPAGTTWTQINITTAQGKWISTSFIKLPVNDSNDFRIQSFGFDNVEIPVFQIGDYNEFQLQGIGGTGNYIFSLASGNLLQGLSLSSTGLISGIATQLEKVYPVFQIFDGIKTFTRTFVMGSILDEIESKEILPPTVGVNYNYQLKTWNNKSGLIWKALDLPKWLSLSTSGKLTNNRVTTVNDVKHFTFKIELYSGTNLLDKRAFESELRYADAAINIFGEQRLKPQQNINFYNKYFVSGGYGDVTWSINVSRSNIVGNTTTITTSSPYAGLTLNSVTGEITGTPLITGTNQYYLRATSNINTSIFFEGLFYIEVVKSGITPKIITRSLATATKGQPYSFQINLENILDAKPYNYEAINLPTGLSINSEGLITGTPTGATYTNGVQLQWSDSVKHCTIRGFRSGSGIYSNEKPSNIHRLENCMISVCDSGIGVRSQAFDSHVSELYIFNCRTGLDFGPGAAAWSFNGRIRIEYIHEDGAKFKTAHENDLSGIFFDTCGWSAIRAEDCRNLLVTGCRFFRSGRNIRGIGTKLNPLCNVEYSNHVWLKDCKRSTFTGNSFDIGTKEGGDGIYLTNHFADNLRPSYGFRIHNTPELNITANNLTGCLETFSANLTDFGKNNYEGFNIANNTQSDQELVPLIVTELAKQNIYIPNNCFSIWQRDQSFNIPIASNGNPNVFPIADGWFIKRGGNTSIDKAISVSRKTDGQIGTGYYLHLEKLANTLGTTQTLELNNYFLDNLKITSNRSIILSYYARSITNCSLGVKISQYCDSPDNSFQSFQFQDNNKIISSEWKRYQHYFKLADLTNIKLGTGAILNLIFRCEIATENINLDITGIQIDFIDQTPFAQPLREKSFNKELKFAQLRYQKSKSYEQYFPSWSEGYRYDVNGLNWNPGFINQLAFTTAGHSLKEAITFENPVLILPRTGTNFQHLNILNPGELTNQNSSLKFNWSGLENPPAYIDKANLQGFSVSARGTNTTANGSYSCHWLYSAYEQDKISNGGGYK